MLDMRDTAPPWERTSTPSSSRAARSRRMVAGVTASALHSSEALIVRCVVRISRMRNLRSSASMSIVCVPFASTRTGTHMILQPQPRPGAIKRIAGTSLFALIRRGGSGAPVLRAWSSCVADSLSAARCARGSHPATSRPAGRTWLPVLRRA